MSQLVFAGLLTIDVAQLAESIPAKGEKGTAASAYLDVGGPAANAAITASLLGGTTRLTTVIGTGDLADYARTVLDRHGVVFDDRAPGSGVPVASIWTTPGERTILATNNSDAVLDVGGVSLLHADAAAVLIDGHYAELAVAVASEAHEMAVPIVLDCGRWRPVYAELMPLATDIIMCDTFRPSGLGELTAEETVAAIYERWQPELCAVTRGAHDVIALDRDGRHTIAVPQVEVVDTMGAGDVLHGAYVHGHYGSGLATIAALHRAVELASKSCEYPGARRGVEEAARTRFRDQADDS
jgi:sugar/nucleoside kinase (ribokinase family)